MQINIEELNTQKGAWTVEAIGSDGEVLKADFSGPDAEPRAREYAMWKFGNKDNG